VGERKQLDELLTVEEVLKILKIPRTTFLLRVSTGEIPSLKIGRHRRFLQEDIYKWLKKKTA
jgi:excisionase family DNA binding protein